MSHSHSEEDRPHVPENAEHEIKKAYNCVIETGVTYSGTQDFSHMPGLNPEVVTLLYERAFNAYRQNDRLAAERWARTVKHLARAFWHEAKIHYLEPKATDLPFLENAHAEYSLHEYSDTTADLLESVSHPIPPGLSEMPDDMKRYLARGKKHLSLLENPQYRHELLRAERIQAAHEYGRVIECLALAYEAESERKKAA